MNLQQIRQKLAYNPNAMPTQKQATRTWLGGISSEYPLALTLTLKQFVEVKNSNGVFYKKLDKDDIRRIATHFTHKLNKEVFGSYRRRTHTQKLTFTHGYWWFASACEME